MTGPTPVRRRWLPRSELVTRLRGAQADPGLRDDLARLAGDTTDDFDTVEEVAGLSVVRV